MQRSRDGCGSRCSWSTACRALQVTSERYERELGDVFALQDDIVQAIVGSIEPALARAERHAWRAEAGAAARRVGVVPARPRGCSSASGPTTTRARRSDSFDGPASSTPTSRPPRRSSRSRTPRSSRTSGPTTRNARPPRRSRAAETSVALDRGRPVGHAALGYACAFSGDRPREIAAFERAIELNPSLTHRLRRARGRALGRPSRRGDPHHGEGDPALAARSADAPPTCTGSRSRT